MRADVDIDIANGPSNATWPLAYNVFLTTLSSQTTRDCGPAEGLMRFLSWVQTNDRAATTVSGLGWGPLSISYKRALIAKFATVECNDEEALKRAYIIGMGGTIRAVNDWAVTYESSSFVQKFYVYDTPTTIKEMIAGNPSLSFWLLMKTSADRRYRFDRLWRGQLRACTD